MEEISDALRERLNGDFIQPRLLTAERAGRYLGRLTNIVRKMHREGVIKKCSQAGVGSGD